MPTLEELQNKYGKKEAFEPQTLIEKHIPKEAISKPKKICPHKNHLELNKKNSGKIS